ncbi:BTAD domain-containing putative transcriptional regulator [Streptomyces sp. NPDC048172]|uniref:AfsR/SARP family transcriptional regulator n=1 Tax=Streptomyces sp. NPDC048172 TaxID=3365505 RepID=UPI0037163B67
MDLLALGPLELWDQGRQFDLGPLKQRRVLAALLHARGAPVPVGTLACRVWSTTAPPADPGAALHAYVSRLRPVLHEAGGDRLGIDRPSHDRYRLRFDPEDVDLLRFRRLRREATAAAERGDRQLAVGKLHTAESEWSGEPLTEFTCDWARALRARLRGERRRVQEQRLCLEMEMGRHAAVLGELNELAARHSLDSLVPFDQRSIGLLILAMYRAGKAR